MLDNSPASLLEHKRRVTFCSDWTDCRMNKGFELADLVGYRLSRKEDFGYVRLSAEALHKLAKFP